MGEVEACDLLWRPEKLDWEACRSWLSRGSCMLRDKQLRLFLSECSLYTAKFWDLTARV